MIHVHYYYIVLYFDYASVDTLAFRGHQGDYGAFYYAFAVELAFYLEDVFGEVDDMLLVILAVSLFGFDCKVEFIAFVQVFHLVLERFQCEAQSRYELEWVLCGSFFCELFFSVFDCVQLIC